MKAKCAECGELFARKQAKQIFCAPACRMAFHNRMAKRGKTLTPLALAYRMKRTSPISKRAHVDFCRVVAQFEAEDKAAGRMTGRAFIAHQYAHWLRQ